MPMAPAVKKALTIEIRMTIKNEEKSDLNDQFQGHIAESFFILQELVLHLLHGSGIQAYQEARW